MDTRRLTPIIIVSILVIILLACGSPVLGTSATSTPTVEPGESAIEIRGGNCANKYYPVSPGATWTYASTGGSGGNYSYVQTILDVSDTKFTAGAVLSTGLSTSASWSCENGNLAALDQGSFATVSPGSGVEVVIDSVLTDGYLIPANFTPGQTWSETLIINSTNYSGGMVLGTGKSITSWECTGGGSESVTVPAGSFLADTIGCSISNVTEATVNGVAYPVPDTSWDTTIWLAKNVGIVQMVSSGDSGNETVVLTDH